MKAADLGNFLWVVVNPDDVVTSHSAKKFCAIPLKYRMMILNGLLLHLAINGEVIPSTNPDGTVSNELERLKPDIFAKGGDRIDNNHMPASEIKICERLGIKIIYGIGDLLNSSSKIWKWTEAGG